MTNLRIFSQAWRGLGYVRGEDNEPPRHPTYGNILEDGLEATALRREGEYGDVGHGVGGAALMASAEPLIIRSADHARVVAELVSRFFRNNCLL